jgi:hypothetical protein
MYQGLELNGKHQLLVYADDVDMLSESINNVKRNTEALFQASKEVDLKVNSENVGTMYLFLVTRVQVKAVSDN